MAVPVRLLAYNDSTNLLIATDINGLQHNISDMYWTNNRSNPDVVTNPLLTGNTYRSGSASIGNPGNGFDGAKLQVAGNVLINQGDNNNKPIPDNTLGTFFMIIPDDGMAIRAGRINDAARLAVWNTTNIGVASMAIGTNNQASGANTMALGQNNNSNSSNTMVAGNTNNISSINALAAGQNNVATGPHIIVAGSNNTVSAGSSLIVGTVNDVDCANSLVGGQNNTVTSTGDNSVVVGDNNNIFSSRSLVGGLNNIMSTNNSLAIGDNNTNQSSGGSGMIISGSGNSVEECSHCLVLNQTSTMSNSSFGISCSSNSTIDGLIRSVALGSNNTCGANNSLICASNANVNGAQNSIIHGSDYISAVTGLNSLYSGSGHRSIVGGRNNQLFGSNNVASGCINSLLSGVGNTISGTGILSSAQVFGQNLIQTVANSTSFGTNGSLPPVVGISNQLAGFDGINPPVSTVRSGAYFRFASTGPGVGDMGQLYVNQIFNTGADVAHMYEIAENSGQTRSSLLGCFVNLVSDRIVLATSLSEATGVATQTPAAVMNSPDVWPGAQLKDEFGRYLTEPDYTRAAQVMLPEATDLPVYIATLADLIEYLLSVGDLRDPTSFLAELPERKVINSAWDPTQVYVPRYNREEWVCVTDLGIVPVVSDDPSIQVGDLVVPNNLGHAVKSLDNIGFHVLAVDVRGTVKIKYDPVVRVISNFVGLNNTISNLQQLSNAYNNDIANLTEQIANLQARLDAMSG